MATKKEMWAMLVVCAAVVCDVVRGVVTSERPLNASSYSRGLVVLGGAEIERSETRRMHYPETGGGRHPQSGGGCDAVVGGAEGWIFTPNYPSDYSGGGQGCSYVVRRLSADTCRVEMTLNDFELEDSAHCLADRLDLSDGGQGVLCGSLASGTKKNLQFRSGQYTMTLRFQTDKERTSKGFMIQLKQIPRSCGATTILPRGGSGGGACNQYLDTFTSSVRSPGYPHGYAPNLRCAYTVRRADPRICKILLEIRMLDFGRHQAAQGSACRGDYLEFPDLSRTCAGHPSRKLVDFVRGSDLLTFTFVTDGYGSGKGFDIEILQVPDSCSAPSPPPLLPRPPGAGGCDQEVVGVTGHLTSPRFPGAYGAHERCRFTLRKAHPSVCSVELHFRRFELEHSGPPCDKDYLAIPGDTRLCGSISGKQLLEFPKDSDYVNLYFVSDGYGHGLGFDIHVTQLFNTCEGHASQGPCDQEVGTYSGRLTSPGYPSSYPGGQRCSYRVRRADRSVCAVDLRFDRFDVESSTNCDKDFLLMPDRTRICGPASGIRTLRFAAGSDLLELSFFSDAHRTGRGFDIEVTQRRNTCTGPPASECGGDVTSSAGRISSPGYPRFYPAGLRCQYRLRRPEPGTCTVELELRSFDVAESAGCSEDYLQLPDDTRLCGTKTHDTKSLDYSAFGSDVMTLTFVTDSLGAGRGFDIVVRQIPNSCGLLPPPPSCDVTVREEGSVLHSPGYPGDYPADSLCVYTVRRLDASVCQLRVHFLDFDLEEGDGGDCSGDFVQLEKGGRRFCGVEAPPPAVLSFGGEDVVRMVFRSDSVSNRRGFEARVRQVRNSCYRPIGPPPNDNEECGGSYSEASMVLQSPPVGAGGASEECTYRVLRHSPAVCQLELRFDRFDLGGPSSTTPTCDHRTHYLEVKGARYCGNRQGQRVLVDFPRDTEEIVLRYRKSHHQQLEHQGSGFRIEGKQLTSGCPPPPDDNHSACGGEEELSGETFQLMSPGYQSGRGYGENAQCRWSVRKASFRVCALQLKFYSFDLEESEGCEKDYLQVGQHDKLCGRMEYDSIRTYEFLEDETAITFHSDAFKNRAGFFILFEQKTC